MIIRSKYYLDYLGYAVTSVVSFILFIQRSVTCHTHVIRPLFATKATSYELCSIKHHANTYPGVFYSIL